MKATNVFKWSIMFLIVCVFLAAVSAQDTSSYEADSLLKTADLYYKSGDYQNSLRSAHMALRAYNRTGDRWGVNKAQKLISNIELVMSPYQSAEMYYNIGGQLYLENQDDKETQELALFFAEKAKAIYLTIGGAAGDAGVLKSNDIINGAKGNIENKLKNCIRKGDEFHSLAQNSFFLGDYRKAYSYALNASTTYLNCPYEPGINKASDLLTSIKGKLGDLRAEAKAAYDQAIKYFTSEQYELCVATAEEAKNLYYGIGDDDGEASSLNIMSQCRERMEGREKFMKDRAEKLKQQAEFLSIIPDCLNATNTANAAREIYQTLLSEYYEKEKDLPRNDRTNTIYYTQKVNEVDDVLNRIRSTCSERETLRLAEDYYRQAQDKYLNHELAEAKNFAQNALRIFTDLKNFVGISKTETLLNQINLRIKQSNTADDALANAYWANAIADYDRAISEINNALAIYKSVKDKKKILEAENLTESIKTNMALFDEGNQIFGKGREYLEYENLDNALAAFTRAKEIYVRINYTLGINKTNEHLAITNELISEKNMEFIKTVLFIAAIIVIPGLLILQIVKRKSAMENEYLERKKAQEEQARREREELELRSQTETKERVDDELRKLIEQERGRVD